MTQKRNHKTNHKARCPECSGTVVARAITLTYAQGEITLQIRDVPALVCARCGKQVVSGEAANRISEILQRLEKNASLRHLSDEVLQLRSAVNQVKAANLEVAFA